MNVLNGVSRMTAKFSLADRYELADGQVLLSGLQALVRALQTRADLDAKRGLSSGGFVSGYRGSPLGSFDKELWSQEQGLAARNVKFQPGVNEDLAATAVWGTQQIGLHTGHQVDGVFGMWYGKAPGLDRSCDAIRHANAWGTSSQGGVLLVVGDDPAAKSSSLSTQSEFTLQDLWVPILSPANVQDVLDFSVLGWEMSRHSGLWVGLKAIADHMDSAATIEVGLDRYTPVDLPLPADAHIRREDSPQNQEARLIKEKLPAAIEFAREAGFNRWITNGMTAGDQRLGIVCAGKAYMDVREALAMLGLAAEQDIADAGIELLKLGMTWPMDEALITAFADRVDQVLVVEEKRAFVETQVKEVLYGRSAVPVIGKRDSSGEIALPSNGILEPAEIAVLIDAELKLGQDAALAQVRANRQALEHVDAHAKQERTPLFCAGCPHNTSTRVPQGSRASAGIGCHYMVQWMNRDADSCTHMGGEGITWVGESLFTDEKHIFANLGDGTYFHSGILAIRQAVSAGVNITYKLLYNDAVAMTGGQSTDGDLDVPALIAQVQAEGVSRVVIVSDTPEIHNDLDIPVYHRKALDDVQRELREVEGVTVLIYQQTCATELRRQRKRGLVEDVKPRVVINEAVCEGCGDCTVKSSCVAVEPIETPFGVKRRVNQTGCNKDLSCAEGYCPSFVEVEGALAQPVATQDSGVADEALPEPQQRQTEGNILITGVGGTGIVTVSALLAAAAKIEAKPVRTLDMTGLAQKGGAVFAHVRIGQTEEADGARSQFTPRIPAGAADTLIACDLVSAASNESLELLRKDTLAVVNSDVLPTADFVLQDQHDTQAPRRSARLRRFVSTLNQLDASSDCQRLFGDMQQANILLMGYAYQLGGLPLRAESIEAAIEVNGAAVSRNIDAFRAGRRAALAAEQPKSSTSVQAMQLDDLLVTYHAHLAQYQNEALADRYVAKIQSVMAAEHAVKANSEVFSRAVARSYLHLLATKDEYEVARLHADPSFQAQLKAQFAPGAKVRYLLAPPALEWFLRGRKIKLGSWMNWAFKGLAACKGLRNTWLDPFAYSAERKLDQRMLAEFERWLDEALAQLSCQNLPSAVALAKLPGEVRGYGHVRHAAYARMQTRWQELQQEFERPPQRVKIFDPTAAAA